MAYNMDYNKMKVILPLFLKKDTEIVDKILNNDFSGSMNPCTTNNEIPREMNYVNDTIDRPLNEICHWRYKKNERNQDILEKPKVKIK